MAIRLLRGGPGSSRSYQINIALWSSLYLLAVLLPSLAVGFRRLHDTSRSAWWLLIGLIPVVGAVVLLVLFVSDGTPGPNRFGLDPKARQPATSLGIPSPNRP